MLFSLAICTFSKSLHQGRDIISADFTHSSFYTHIIKNRGKSLSNKIFIRRVVLNLMKREKIEAIYENGLLRIIKPAKIESDVLTVKILNRDEVLTDEDMKDILEAIDEREKGECHSFDEVFE